MNASELLNLSQQIENLLVAKNLRGMKSIQPELKPGYCLRAATILKDISGYVLIGTGFPVIDTFETDGPVGALVLYKALEKLGAKPVIVCGTPMANILQLDYKVFVISEGSEEFGKAQAKRALEHFKPEAVISIERPGLAADGFYYNMRGENISARTACFDYFLNDAECPTIAIGDGGNEIGMGNVKDALASLNIIPAITTCDELIVADVSNWGVYGILAFLQIWNEQDLLSEVQPEVILGYLSSGGSVDGVTRINELTEDGLPASVGIQLINDIKHIITEG